MFGFWKKTVDYQKIQSFSDAIGAIKLFIWMQDFEKAHIALREIREKEKASFNTSLIEIRDTQEKTRLTNEFNRNNKIIEDLEYKVKVKEEEYKEKKAKETFTLKFKKIREELYQLGKTNRHQDALLLLGTFFEENKENLLVVKFYDEEKKKILKAIAIQRKKEESNLKKNAETEAMKLIWETIKGKEVSEEWNEENKTEKVWFDILAPFKRWKKLLETIKEWRKRRKLLDEVTQLIEVENQVNMEVAKNKLEKVHQWLIKELSMNNIEWYEFFGKILWADRITGDTFWFHDEKEKYNFFLWDATGHGVKAGLIVSLLSRLFSTHVAWNYLTKFVLEVNNWLKQELQSRNFITWIFFEITKTEIDHIRFVGMWHEPLFVYRDKTKTVEKYIPGWLAAWIRLIKDISFVKEKDIFMEANDILICYSDGIAEARNVEGTLFWVDGIEQTFKKIAPIEKNLGKIYNFLMDEVKIWRGWSKFEDDATIMLLRRDENKDVIKNQNNSYIQEVAKKEGIGKFGMRKFIGKTREEIEKELEIVRKQKELASVIKVLENLYYTWEILRLKQEAIRFIKAWFIDKKINYYLKKAIANENNYKIDQKEKKILAKYNVLEELFKKWDYDTVIKECNEIIAKNWTI